MILSIMICLQSHISILRSRSGHFAQHTIRCRLRSRSTNIATFASYRDLSVDCCIFRCVSLSRLIEQSLQHCRRPLQWAFSRVFGSLVSRVCGFCMNQLIIPTFAEAIRCPSLALSIILFCSDHDSVRMLWPSIIVGLFAVY